MNTLKKKLGEVLDNLDRGIVSSLTASIEQAIQEGEQLRKKQAVKTETAAIDKEHRDGKSPQSTEGKGICEWSSKTATHKNSEVKIAENKSQDQTTVGHGNQVSRNQVGEKLKERQSEDTVVPLVKSEVMHGCEKESKIKVPLEKSGKEAELYAGEGGANNGDGVTRLEKATVVQGDGRDVTSRETSGACGYSRQQKSKVERSSRETKLEKGEVQGYVTGGLDADIMRGCEEEKEMRMTALVHEILEQAEGNSASTGAMAPQTLAQFVRPKERLSNIVKLPTSKDAENRKARSYQSQELRIALANEELKQRIIMAEANKEVKSQNTTIYDDAFDAVEVDIDSSGTSLTEDRETLLMEREVDSKVQLANRFSTTVDMGDPSSDEDSPVAEPFRSHIPFERQSIRLPAGSKIRYPPKGYVEDIRSERPPFDHPLNSETLNNITMELLAGKSLKPADQDKINRMPTAAPISDKYKDAGSYSADYDDNGNPLELGQSRFPVDVNDFNDYVGYREDTSYRGRGGSEKYGQKKKKKLKEKEVTAGQLEGNRGNDKVEDLVAFISGETASGGATKKGGAKAGKDEGKGGAKSKDEPAKKKKKKAKSTQPSAAVPDKPQSRAEDLRDTASEDESSGVSDYATVSSGSVQPDGSSQEGVPEDVVNTPPELLEEMLELQPPRAQQEEFKTIASKKKKKKQGDRKKSEEDITDSAQRRNSTGAQMELHYDSGTESCKSVPGKAGQVSTESSSAVVSEMSSSNEEMFPSDQGKGPNSNPPELTGLREKSSEPKGQREELSEPKGRREEPSDSKGQREEPAGLRGGATKEPPSTGGRREEIAVVSVKAVQQRKGAEKTAEKTTDKQAEKASEKQMGADFREVKGRQQPGRDGASEPAKPEQQQPSDDKESTELDPLAKKTSERNASVDPEQPARKLSEGKATSDVDVKLHSENDDSAKIMSRDGKYVADPQRSRAIKTEQPVTREAKTKTMADSKSEPREIKARTPTERYEQHPREIKSRGSTPTDRAEPPPRDTKPRGTAHGDRVEITLRDAKFRGGSPSDVRMVPQHREVRPRGGPLTDNRTGLARTRDTYPRAVGLADRQDYSAGREDRHTDRGQYSQDGRVPAGFPTDNHFENQSGRNQRPRRNDGRGPPFDGRGPPGEGRGPPGDSRGTPFDGRTPPVDSRGPPGDGRGPPFDGRGPPGDGRAPPVDSRGPPGDSRVNQPMAKDDRSRQARPPRSDNRPKPNMDPRPPPQSSNPSYAVAANSRTMGPVIAGRHSQPPDPTSTTEFPPMAQPAKQPQDWSGRQVSPTSSTDSVGNAQAVPAASLDDLPPSSQPQPSPSGTSDDARFPGPPRKSLSKQKLFLDTQADMTPESADIGISFGFDNPLPSGSTVAAPAKVQQVSDCLPMTEELGQQKDQQPPVKPRCSLEDYRLPPRHLNPNYQDGAFQREKVAQLFYSECKKLLDSSSKVCYYDASR